MPPRHDVAAQSFAAVRVDRLDRLAMGVLEEARPGQGCEARSAPQRAARERERASRAGAQARGAGFLRWKRACLRLTISSCPPAPSLARQVIVKAMIKDGKIAKWSYYGESARCASIFVDGVEGMSK